ncbi:hypothetical protein [Helicobacter bilis]|nr:hypothetical protein [Helicobacter bilis]
MFSFYKMIAQKSCDIFLRFYKNVTLYRTLTHIAINIHRILSEFDRSMLE